MKLKWASGGIVGILTLLLGVSEAGAISYTLNLGSASVSVTGTIVTDDHIGTLSKSNIVDWSLVLTNGLQVTGLTGPGSGGNSTIAANIGTDFSATASGLFYNFASTSIGLLTPLFTSTANAGINICF